MHRSANLKQFFLAHCVVFWCVFNKNPSCVVNLLSERQPYISRLATQIPSGRRPVMKDAFCAPLVNKN
jgi:hypothetical protein